MKSAVAGVTVAGPGSRILARRGGRDLVPRIPGRWRLLLARWFWGAAWLLALTTRSSGRMRVTPSRRRALWPWARRPITLAAAWCRATFFHDLRQCSVLARQHRCRPSASPHRCSVNDASGPPGSCCCFLWGGFYAPPLTHRRTRVAHPLSRSGLPTTAMAHPIPALDNNDQLNGQLLVTRRRPEPRCGRTTPTRCCSIRPS
jgi:hypothetical protein